jgi:GNAT superfamily N-acetyltransferase
VRLRPAGTADVPALLEITREGMKSYRDFAPPGWVPPSFDELDTVGIDDVATWILAEEDGEPVGHTLLIPAARSREPVDDPSLGHLMQLFVRRSHWGRGVAGALHAAIVAAAGQRGFSQIRLYTPAGHARARRFYEREGWREVGRMEETPLGFPVVEYRFACRTPS